MTETYLSGIGLSLWLGSILAATCALAFRAVPSIAPAWRYRLWLAVLLLCAALPFTGFLSRGPDLVVRRATVAVPAPATRPAAVNVPSISRLGSGTPIEFEEAPPVAAPRSVSIGAAAVPLLAALLAAGGLIGMTLLIGQLLRLHLLKRRAHPLDECVELAREVPAAGLRRARLLASADLTQPSACGYLRPAIMLPTSLLPHLDAEQLEHLLLHEAAHLRRWDDCLLLFERILLILSWWHPASWWVRRQLDTSRELACDALVAERTDRRAYARTLVALAELSLPSSSLLAPAATQGVLSHRVTALLQRDVASGGIARAISGAIAVVGVSLGLLVHPPSVHTRRIVSDTVTAMHGHAGFARGAAAIRMDSLISGFERAGFSGTVLVAQGDAVLLDKGYGFADRASGTAMLRSTRFSAAGMTKMFTAAAILVLQDEGKLRVTDSLYRWFPDLPSSMGDVTLHQLLIHADGLTRLSAPVYRADADDFIDAVAAGPVSFAPGTAYRYNDFGHSILGVIIERATGQPYESYIRARFLEPARMSHTSFESDGDDYATEYSGMATTLKPIAPRAYIWGRRGSLGLVTTAEDLFRWSRAMHDSRVLPASVWQEMQVTFGRTDWQADAGYGWDRMPGTGLWRRVAGTPGMEGELLYDPATDWTAVILVNTRLGWRFKVWDIVTDYTD